MDFLSYVNLKTFHSAKTLYINILLIKKKFDTFFLKENTP